jgi:hypothetical protein
LPFYDYELIDFYSQVPVCLRYQQRLYVRTLIENLFIDDLAALAQIPVASLGPMQPPEATWKDRLLMRGIAAPLSDWLLDRAMHTKRLEHLRSVGARSADPSGPDPLDHWWHEYPDWRRSVRAMFFGWDGMHEIMDVSALLRLLEEPLPRLFVQFGIPAFLTLRFFQELLEGALRNGTLSQVSALQPIPAENTPPEFKINLSGNQPNKYR